VYNKLTYIFSFQLVCKYFQLFTVVLQAIFFFIFTHTAVLYSNFPTCVLVLAFLATSCTPTGMYIMHVCVTFNQDYHDKVDFIVLNGYKDDFPSPLDEPPHYARMSKEQFKEYNARHGHCSALVKVTYLHCYDKK